MNQKKKHLIPLASMAMVAILSACNGGGNTGTSNTGGGNSDTSGGGDSSFTVDVDPMIRDEISILIPSGNANETTMIDKAFEGFQMKFPNVTLKKSYVTISAYEESIIRQSMAGNLPDIVWTNTPEYLFLIGRNIVEPLTKYIEASEAKGDYDFEADFKTAYFEMCKTNNDYYVVPRSADSIVTFYNKKLLTEAGISMDKIQNGWTWGDFLDICEQYRTYLDNNGHQDDGYYVVDACLTGWGSVSYPMLRSMGGEVLDKDGKVIFNSQGTKDAVELIRGLTETRYSVKVGDTSVSSFESGTSPFIFQSAAFSLYDNRAALKGNIDVVNFPLIKGEGTPNTPYIGSGVAGYSMNKKADNKALCWQFLNHLISHEGQEQMAEGGLNNPPIRTDMEDFTQNKWGEGYEDKNLSAYTVYDEYKITEEYLSYANPTCMADLQLAFEDFVADSSQGRKTVDQVVNDAVSAFQDALDI